ncbi:dihydropteroate synthase [Microbulbifer thermotolerans]|uniref:Dihydropteroate synthase n=1 Tax=Microbulbifer thermotolerans TaxID=252514 RepID=A0A143HJZ9_MICTH|nr:dihydropteroate synthase [Microbulbifer thermotolerans]AMX01826.1 dihydropteroate synthase [Microbulbifer thermotolerans]MCX2779289.1 dihydropteroate synthase [Microbulbifer thermotolerans]MCX2783965.1 dihydropteroate synthase [Microbulbifer thermotolerans]MCX2793486.1 dihydropteroate synthase [Microbulbifer thermotolerans]MCX2802679.1 dihydropteroate synthase [Microbulbifer thermotolerans]
MQLVCGKHTLDLTNPVVMGILNTTPDSFSDGGNCYSAGSLDLDLALRRAEQMLREGAAIIDVGGESTRPGALPVGEQEELDRVLPVVEAINNRFDVVISVDTSTPSVMTAAAAAGAGLINDVRALERPGALEAAAASGLPVCLMHMQGQPGDMQLAPHYEDVVREVGTYFSARMRACEAAGIPRERVILDPGFGFGKDDNHHLALMRNLAALAPPDVPLLVGVSRKSMIGRLLNRELHERLPGSLALAMLAAERGAKILRVHDVAATVDVLRMWAIVEGGALSS